MSDKKPPSGGDSKPSPPPKPPPPIGHQDSVRGGAESGGRRGRVKKG